MHKCASVYMYICIYLNCAFVSYDLGEKQHFEYFFHSFINTHFSLKGKLRDGFIYKIIQITWTYVLWDLNYNSWNMDSSYFYLPQSI